MVPIINNLNRASHEQFKAFIEGNIQNEEFIVAILFFIGSAIQEYKEAVADQLSSLLLESQNPQAIPTVFYFIGKCGIYSKNFGPGLINLVLTNFGLNPIQASECIYQFSDHQPQLLVHISDLILSLLAEESLEMEIIKKIISSIFKILQFTNFLENPAFQLVPRYIMKVFEDSMSEHDLERFVKFMISIVESTSNNHELYNEFLNMLSMSIFSGLQPCLLIDDKQLQQNFCKMFGNMIENKWINDEGKINLLKWIEAVLPVFPCYDHFYFLQSLIDFFPSEPICQFILTYDYDTTEFGFNLSCEIIKFIQFIFEHKHDLFFAIFPPEWLYNLINIHSLAQSIAVLDFFIVMSDSPNFALFSIDFFVNLLHFLFESIKNNFENINIGFYRVSKIEKICLNISVFIDPNVIAQIFLEHFQPPTQNIEQIAFLFASHKYSELSQFLEACCNKQSS